MTDEGHTMSSDMSGPVRFMIIPTLFATILAHYFRNLIVPIFFSHFRLIRYRMCLISIQVRFDIYNN